MNSVIVDTIIIIVFLNFIQFLQRPFTPNDENLKANNRFVSAAPNLNGFIEKFDHEANYNRDFPNNRRKSQPTHPDYEQYEQFEGAGNETSRNEENSTDRSFVSESKLVSINKKSTVTERSMVSESLLMFVGDKSKVPSIRRPSTGGAESQV